MTIIKVTYKDNDKGVEFIHVPKTELLILQTLSSDKLSAPQITRKSASKISVNGVYTLLNRLIERGLVKREEGVIQVQDISHKRVYYERAFKEMEIEEK